MSTTNFRTGITAVAVLVGLVSIGYAQTFTTFDVPGAAGTIPLSINPAGQITGAVSPIHKPGRPDHGAVLRCEPCGPRLPA